MRWPSRNPGFTAGFILVHVSARAAGACASTAAATVATTMCFVQKFVPMIPPKNFAPQALLGRGDARLAAPCTSMVPAEGSGAALSTPSIHPPLLAEPDGHARRSACRGNDDVALPISVEVRAPESPIRKPLERHHGPERTTHVGVKRDHPVVAG